MAKFKDKRENIHVFYNADEWLDAVNEFGESVSPGGICAKYRINRQTLNNLINRDGLVQAYYYIDPYRYKQLGYVANSAYCLIPLAQFRDDPKLIEWMDRHFMRTKESCR